MRKSKNRFWKMNHNVYICANNVFYMNINKIIEVHNYLAGLELSKFDKDVRSAVRKNYVATYKVLKDFEETQDILRKKCFDGKEKIQQKVQDLRARFQKATTAEEKMAIEKEAQQEEFVEYFKIEREFISLIEDELKKDAPDVELVKVDEDTWIENLAKAEIKFTVIDIDKIECMLC